jgi:hypothetical protein
MNSKASFAPLGSKIGLKNLPNVHRISTRVLAPW